MTKRSSKPIRYAIGIDPPRGWALYDRDTRELEELKTTDFWGLVGMITDFAENLIGEYESNGCDYRLLFVIEAVWLNPPTFSHGEVGDKIREKIAQNVGENKAAAKLLFELLERIRARDPERISVLSLRPSKKTGSKMTASEFGKKTGWPFTSSEHSRDAAMLIYGR